MKTLLLLGIVSATLLCVTAGPVIIDAAPEEEAKTEEAPVAEKARQSEDDDDDDDDDFDLGVDDDDDDDDEGEADDDDDDDDDDYFERIFDDLLGGNEVSCKKVRE